MVPEIELPGHSLAALAAYPELGCTGGPYEVGTRWGVIKDVYCAGNPKVYAFNEGVLSEVLAIFPSNFIHIGGDEVRFSVWENCPHIQKFMADNRIKDAHALQSYFIANGRGSWRRLEA